MKSKIRTVIILFVILTSVTGGELGCGQRERGPDEAKQVKGSRDGRSGKSVLPRVMRNVLQWQAGDLTGVETAKRLNVNVVHCFPMVPNIRGYPPETAMQEWLGRWSDQINELHKEGIIIFASLGSTCFNPERFKEHGLNPEIYYARDENNRRSMMLGGSFGKDIFTSCYSNPHWIELLRKRTMAYADAGFDGIWYDVGGLADPAVFYCQCAHCKKRWRAHLVEAGRDGDIALPARKTGQDYSKWVNREFLLWRWKEWIKWERSVKESIRARHPSFIFSHNLGVKESSQGEVSVFLHSTTDLFDYVHWEEWGHSTAPYSVIPSYLLGLAAGSGKQVVLVQNDNPLRNELQHKIFLAEGYASGGVQQISANRFDANRNFMDFVEKYEDYYAAPESRANVAVVYSWWSQGIYARPQKLSPGYWMGQLLLDLHIPFDYIIVERDLKREVLARYMTIILPDLGYMTDVQIERIKQFLQAGGSVFATNNTGKYDKELKLRNPSGLDLIADNHITGTVRRESGKGRFAYFSGYPEKEYWQKNPRQLNEGETLAYPGPVPVEVRDALHWCFRRRLPLEVEARSTTAVILKSQPGRILIHLVNYNVYPDGKQITPDKNIRLYVSIPAGGKVRDVFVISPDFEGRKNLTDWGQINGRLHLVLDELEHYSVIVINMR